MAYPEIPPVDESHIVVCTCEVSVLPDPEMPWTALLYSRRNDPTCPVCFRGSATE